VLQEKVKHAKRQVEEIQVLETKVSEREEAIRVLEKKVEDAERQAEEIRVLETKVSEREEAIRVLEKKVREREEKIRVLEKKASQIRAAMEARTSELVDQNRKLRSRIRELQHDVTGPDGMRTVRITQRKNQRRRSVFNQRESDCPRQVQFPQRTRIFRPKAGMQRSIRKRQFSHSGASAIV
jgi:predicted RNase H-like nuclease (RuvC/YqgF family)